MGSWERTKKFRDAAKVLGDASRYVDFGVRLYAVDRDEERGRAIDRFPDLPPFRAHDRRDFGGIIDTYTRRIVAPSERPVVWFASLDQFPLICHDDDLKPWVLAVGSFGGGKTETLAQWLILRSLAAMERRRKLRRGCVLGTAPNADRVEILRGKVSGLMRDDWYTWNERHKEFRMATGVPIVMRGTQRQSYQTGSPFAGVDAFAAGSDEIQDSIHDAEVEPEIQGRGRVAPRGRYLRLCTATAKRTSKWRTYRDTRTSDLWDIRRMKGKRNPFVSPEHWENLLAGLSYDEARRVVDAEDTPLERPTYPEFLRSRHLTPLPELALDVTEHVASTYPSYLRQGSRWAMVIGHDPGKLKNTSVLMKAYWFPARAGGRLSWIAVGEFITEGTTQDQHAKKLKQHLQERYGIQYDPEKLDPDSGLRRAIVFRDPHTRQKTSADQDADIAFRKHGIDIFPASSDKQQIKKRTRIEMVNRLLLSADRMTRLYVACGDDGAPLCPELVESLEGQQDDERGESETQRKGEGDITHPAVALGYGLFPLERIELSEYTEELARGAAS